VNNEYMCLFCRVWVGGGRTCPDLQAARRQTCGRVAAAVVGGSEGGVHADDVAALAGLDGFHPVAPRRA